jgi:hypothetical protein
VTGVIVRIVRVRVVNISIRIIAVVRVIIAIMPVIPRIHVPGTVIAIPVDAVPVVIRGFVNPRVIPEAQGPAVIPVAVPGAVVIKVPEIPRTVSVGIVPGPGREVLHLDYGIILIEADGFARGDHQGVSSAKDIGL